MAAMLGLILSVLCFSSVDSTQLPPIYWNSSNELFRHDRVLTVKLRDAIDIHCPFYNDTVTQDEAEYSLIYKVSKESYDECELDKDARAIGQCASPIGGEPTIVKLTFREFSPLPSAIEVEPGEIVYFISTSDGTKSGLNNKADGLCRSAHLRLRFKVEDESKQADRHGISTQNAPDLGSTISNVDNGFYATGRASSALRKPYATTDSRRSAINDREENDQESVGVKFVVDDNKLIQSTSNGGVDTEKHSDGRANSLTYDVEVGSNSVKRDYPSMESRSRQQSSFAKGKEQDIVLYEIHEVDAQRIHRYNYNSASVPRLWQWTLFLCQVWCVLTRVWSRA